VTPTGVAGLTFQDEALAANRAVDALAKRGAKIPVLVVHQGGGVQTSPALGGAQDVDALIAYVKANEPDSIAVPAGGRIVPVS